MPRLTVRSARAALLAAPLCIATLLPGDLAAQPAPPKDRLTVADYFNWEDVAAPAMSPDGKQIIYTRTWMDQLNDRRESSVWIMNADGTRNRFLVKGSDAKWSPDGSRIAFVAPGEPGGAQIWVRYMDAEGATTQVTRLTEAPADVEWSPDGKTIGFGMLVRGTDTWRIAMPAAPKGAKWTEAPRVVTKVKYRADRQGFLEDGLRQLFT
ncbi:MAG: S9 family peptidase, partial [Gemmatimonadota bacterium]|nr:S9 family peptidase [Gemmatimonadota bacterium]